MTASFKTERNKIIFIYTVTQYQPGFLILAFVGAVMCLVFHNRVMAPSKSVRQIYMNNDHNINSLSNCTWHRMTKFFQFSVKWGLSTFWKFKGFRRVAIHELNQFVRFGAAAKVWSLLFTNVSKMYSKLLQRVQLFYQPR